ncbi:MAG: O-methyltransferase [Planctomycetota bacterium]|jgi:predicted O-methyltransferase YrrM
MSATGTLVTSQHFEYLTARTTPEDRLLADLKAEASAAGIPAIWISPAQASLMQILLRACGAHVVVEVGTLAGYSAIAMARALPADGHVHTIELEPAHADFAEAWIARSDVAGRISVHRGAGADVLPRLPLAPGGADAIFLDADKAGYPVYLEHGLRLVRPGGLVLVDNAFAFGQLFDAVPTDREVGAVRAFNEVMAAEARVQSVIVPIGDGLWVGVRLPD